MFSKKKNHLAFVGHILHSRTKSDEFIKEIFKKSYKIKNYFHSDYKKKDLQKYSYIFFFQYLPPISELVLLRKSKIIWAPMYDSLSNLDPNIWKICSLFPNIKILSFSKEINKFCNKNKLNYLYCRYFLNIQKNTISPGKKLKFLFWYRGEIKFNSWKRYIDPSDIEYINYYKLVDPFYKDEELTKSDISKYKLKIIRGNYKYSKKKFLSLLDNSDIFICPRAKEGIGMSLIEALCRSKYIIAYDNSTMSDYIYNNKVGYLIKNKLTRIKFLNFKFVKKNFKFRQKYSQEIFNEWQQKKKHIELIYNFKVKKMENMYNKQFFKLYIFNFMFTLKNKIKKFIRSRLKKIV